MAMARMRLPSLPDQGLWPEKRPHTAAGPSRIRTGVPCLPARKQRLPSGHQSRWGNVPVAARLSSEPCPDRTTRTACQAGCRRWQTLTVAEASTVNPCGSCGPRPHQPNEPRARQCFADWQPLMGGEKNRRAPSSRFVNTADSPHVPRGITVPVGQPGGGSNLQFFESRNGSTGLSQKKFVDHNLGVTTSRAGRTHR